MKTKLSLVIMPQFWFSLLFESSWGWRATALSLAALLDYSIGDPWNWLHPVQVMGQYIQRYSQGCLKRLQHPLLLRVAGVGLGVTTIGLSGMAGWLSLSVFKLTHPALGLVTEILLLASCFAGRSLRDAAGRVLQPLVDGDLQTARTVLSRYVGRDTVDLPESEILRAVLETVTENATDGVMAPLFYAILGAFSPVGAVPVALAYKAASTLDSMVGYRTAPYTHLGWFSARLEDCLTWLPCRLHVLTLALLSGRPGHVLRLCQRDGVKDLSPNSGWSETAYAAVLGVQVGGMNRYGAVVKQKPLLGEPIAPITPEKIWQATRLTRWCFLLWLSLAIGMLSLATFVPAHAILR
jgi:adenosylcobinamide-phosphate synthase